MIPAWHEGLTHNDWLMDGYPIRAQCRLAAWNALDWSKAYVDMGPSVAGNPGPYWHVPRTDSEIVHRLYPKLALTKWVFVVQQVVSELSQQQIELRRKQRRAAFEAGKRAA